DSNRLVIVRLPPNAGRLWDPPRKAGRLDLSETTQYPDVSVGNYPSSPNPETPKIRRARAPARAPGLKRDVPMNQAAFAKISSIASLSPTNSWRSTASWQVIQYLVHGTASSRFGLMFSSQCMQMP